jgi:hypothetical protein
VVQSDCHEQVVKLLLADSRVDPSAGQPCALESASQTGRIRIVRMLLAHPRTVVTREAIIATDVVDNNNSAITILFEEVPRLLLRLFDGEVKCKPDGVFRTELHQRQKRSAWAFLLAVEHRGRGLRLADVLREVLEEYTPFDVVDDDDDVVVNV